MKKKTSKTKQPSAKKSGKEDPTLNDLFMAIVDLNAQLAALVNEIHDVNAALSNISQKRG